MGVFFVRRYIVEGDFVWKVGDLGLRVGLGIRCGFRRVFDSLSFKCLFVKLVY